MSSDVLCNLLAAANMIMPDVRDFEQAADRAFSTISAD